MGLIDFLEDPPGLIEIEAHADQWLKSGILSHVGRFPAAAGFNLGDAPDLAVQVKG